MKGPAIFCFLLITTSVLGQEQRMPPAPKNGERAFIQFVIMNPKANVLLYMGTPYFLPDWETATLTTYEGQVFPDVRMKYNINNGSIWYQPSFTLDSLQIKDQFIQAFTFSTGEKAYTFKKIGLEKGKKSGSSKPFFQVLVEGRYALMAVPEKVETQLPKSPLLTTRDEPVIKYIDKVTYHVQVDDASPVKLKNKKARQSIFSDQWSTLDNYVSSEKLGWTAESDLIQIVTYYNSLFPE